MLTLPAPPIQAPPCSPESQLALLHLCKSPRDLHQLHAFSIKSGLFLSPSVSARFLSLYSRPDLGTLSESLCLFSHLPRTDSFSFNALIKRYVADHQPHLALCLFRDMLSIPGATPDGFTFPLIIKGCAQVDAVHEGRQIHALVFKLGFALDGFVQCSLVSFYSKCGDMWSAHQVFDRIRDKDLVTRNSMIDGYVKSGEIDIAKRLFDEMPERDLFSWTSLVSGYSRCGKVEIAREVFDLMPEKSVVSWNAMVDGYMKNGKVEAARELFDQMPEKNVVSWNSMITGYEKAGFFKEATEVYDEMLTEGVNPSFVTFVSVLSAVSGLALLERGRLIHEHICRNGLSLNGVLGICLIEMYSKCGSIESAISLFEEISRKKLGHWTAMIVGLGLHGMADSAFKFFSKMVRIGMKPNAITFIGVLNACSHAGMVDEGHWYFKLMRERYEIEPTMEHYGCFIDLLCRVGNLDEARDVINEMPMRPNKVIWMTLLSGCRKHENSINIAEFAVQNIMELDPGATGCYVLLSNIYAASGLWDNVSKLRQKMKEQGVRKDPGCSSMEFRGKVHEFLVADRSHPQTEEIYNKLNEMGLLLRHAGYIPDKTQVLLCVNEKEKETELSLHSERLAIAFGLINIEQGRPIRIVKNLRVCNDCHNVTKLISRIYDCEIVVRDNSRFHHFSNGKCSCMDFW
ncbi:pentatricopeptide repeat-containing protein At2g29760, chloroplastic-like [Dioscorea cayenensis subsp. rotundata]|uniref:Pentatricopeptide repeat-containing protein At2g29760, chloroplastic-like n=1 Tax=Dioscorea cayennensis subsp. rotundata TaxID=55577 RepID=A0AB40AKV6_DIOCR|nr:pentatricopeptide repeat-containing protein At2g29760, chloroplastic-like [Dioscorea cayenensis subsp. rotundata]